jgi:hypothetical protein
LTLFEWQAGGEAANSVLGTLVDQDRGSNMEMGGSLEGVHVLQADVSQASHQQADVGLQQEPSYQGSVMPTPSANGANPIPPLTSLVINRK